MDKGRFLCADTHQIMAFDAETFVEHKDNKALDFRVEIWGCLDMQPPVTGGQFRCSAKIQLLVRWTFPQRLDFVFVGLGTKFEWLHKPVKAPKGGGFIH
jgi:hypothetical protein